MKQVAKGFYSNGFIIAVFIVCIILNSGHALQTIFPFHILLYTILLDILLIIPLVNFFTTMKLNLLHYSFIFFLVMITLTATAHLGQDGIIPYILKIPVILFAFGIVTLYDFKSFSKIFLITMDAVSVIGIIGYYLVNETSVLNSLPLMTNVTGAEYHVGIVFNFMPIVSFRNCGMFWEPGIFASFLVLGLIFEMIFKDGKITTSRIILYTFAIFTANSAAGFLLLFFCIVLLSVRNKSFIKHNIIQHFLATVFFLIGITLLFNINSIVNFIINSQLGNELVFFKLFFENIEENTRFLAIDHNMDLFIKHPFFGAGIIKTNQAMEFVADTSTSTHLMSVYGIFGSLYTILFLYGIAQFKSHNIYVKTTILIIVIFILNKEPHFGIAFSWCFLFYLLKETTLRDKAIIGTIPIPKINETNQDKSEII